MASNVALPKADMGVTHFAISRIKKIIKEDEDIGACSNDVVFLISMATELFAEFFATKACEYAKREKRKTLLYKDLARAVKEYDSLFFLADIIEDTVVSNPLSATFSKKSTDKAPATNEASAEDENGEEGVEAEQDEPALLNNENVL